MIRLEDLQEAIAECLGQRNPDASTCIKLAAFYTIKENLYPEIKESEPDVARYSFAPAPIDEVTYDGNSEFARAITGRVPDDIWKIMDELMDALSVLNPRLYNSVMDKISEM